MAGPSIVSTQDITGQSSPSTVTAYTTTANGAGFYRVGYVVESASTSDVFSGHVTYTDTSGAKSGATVEVFPVNGITTQTVFSIASSPINVNFTLNSTTNFNVHIRVEKL